MAIKINPANKGKFTAKARAVGQGVQQYARQVLASKTASPTTKKQANFARNAAKWHHGGGATVGTGSPFSEVVEMQDANRGNSSPRGPERTKAQRTAKMRAKGLKIKGTNQTRAQQAGEA